MIWSHFADLIRSKIIRYETAEILHDDGEWSSWPDLPIRIYTDPGGLTSISWSHFDRLWMAKDLSLPFSAEAATVRWIENSIEEIAPCIGQRVVNVMLGQGQMTWEGAEVDIWTRLLIKLDNGWLEIANALDENGYAFHHYQPTGNFIPCS